MGRLTTREVCALLRISRATLFRRMKAGVGPAPIDRGRQLLFDEAAIRSHAQHGPCSLTLQKDSDATFWRAVEARRAGHGRS